MSRGRGGGSGRGRVSGSGRGRGRGRGRAAPNPTPTPTPRPNRYHATESMRASRRMLELARIPTRLLVPKVIRPASDGPCPLVITPRLLVPQARRITIDFDEVDR